MIIAFYGWLTKEAKTLHHEPIMNVISIYRACLVYPKCKCSQFGNVLLEKWWDINQPLLWTVSAGLHSKRPIVRRFSSKKLMSKVLEVMLDFSKSQLCIDHFFTKIIEKFIFDDVYCLYQSNKLLFPIFFSHCLHFMWFYSLKYWMNIELVCS